MKTFENIIACIKDIYDHNPSNQEEIRGALLKLLNELIKRV